jgi:diadenosine tetraphosphatase ApaH/serine/threonine PP2A family protein phosphatase
MKAIFSDVHANLEALRAVLEFVARLGVTALYNLGDMTGYGPNPIECIDLSMSMDVVLQGNFDYAVLIPPEGFGLYAEQSIQWTTAILQSSPVAPREGRSRLEFLSGLRTLHQEGDVSYVHASLRNHRNEYVFPEDIYNLDKMGRIGEKIGHVCFSGHTHLPGIFVENGRRRWQFLCPEQIDNFFRLDERKVLCNVGSVGQPRDGNWRAGFVLFDGSAIQFVRIEYDVETTVRKIYAEPALAHFSGDRLREGR